MKSIFSLILFSIVIISCNKKDIDAPNFNVSTETNTYSVGDTVNFLLAGNPNHITFYSGEEGHIYEFRDRITAGARTDVGVPIKNMTTNPKSYAYIYDNPGSYVVTFVASNTTIYGSATQVKEVSLVIEP